MKQTIASVTAVCLSLSASGSDLLGWWKTDISGVPVIAHITGTADSPRAMIFAPTQTSDSIPAEEVTIKGDTLRLASNALRASFEGVCRAKRIGGIFRQRDVTVPVTFERTSAEESMSRRPQTPRKFQYGQREVSIASDTVTLGGTLTSPWGTPPHGAVVFISGSGAQDRDETISGHKPFAVISDALTRAGWITLRCDDRGVGASSEGNPDAGMTELAADPLAQIAWLRTLPELKDKPIGLLGHSQGGDIAFIAAALQPEAVDFIVTVGAPGIKGKEIVLRQNQMLAFGRLPQPVTAAIDSALTLLASDIPSEEVTPRVKEILSGFMPATAVEKQLTVMASESYRDLLRHDPAEWMPKVKCPVFALNGINDMQVDAEPNLKAISESIPQAKTKAYAGLNHLLQPCDYPTINYGTIQQTIDTRALSDILDFLLTTFPTYGNAQ